MKNRIKESINNFMYGRYGNDTLNMFLLALSGISLLIAIITKLSPIIYLAMALLFFAYFRILSKNIAKRQSENIKYLSLRSKLFVYLKNIKERWVQRKDYKFFTCPSCKATLRVPRGRGKIKIVCRKCGNSFIGKS